MIIMRFIRWLLGLFGRLFPGRGQGEQRRETTRSRTITTLLIYPRVTDDLVLGETTQVDSDKYLVTTPWIIDGERVNQAVRFAEDWLAEALDTRINWQPVLTINSQRSVSE